MMRQQWVGSPDTTSQRSLPACRDPDGLWRWTRRSRVASPRTRPPVLSRRLRAFAFLLISAVLAASPAAAADLSDVLPALKTAPVPASIIEGRRLNYLVEVATVPSAYFYEWVDQAGTTNDYHVPSPSGRGYTQVDVIGVTPSFVALKVQPWLYHNFTGPLIPQFGADEALICHAGGGDWYAHPDVLATVTPTQQQGLKIVRLPLMVGNRVFNALRIQSETEISRAVTCYDLTTGYLIYKAGAVTGDQGVTLTQASFTGSRDPSVPWASGSLPAWVALHPRLRYDGTYTAAAAGSFPLTLALTADITITGHARNWFLYEQATTLASLPGMPPTIECKTLASGVPSLSPLCLPIPLPPSLNAGRLLDRDDVTGATLEVTHAANATGSMNLTLRLSVGDVAWSETTYDSGSGVALELRTYSGASPLYSTSSALRLSALPPTPPNPPRLSVVRATGTRSLVLSWPSESGHRYTLESSDDGGQTWAVVNGHANLPGTGQVMTMDAMTTDKSAWFRVAVF